MENRRATQRRMLANGHTIPDDQEVRITDLGDGNTSAMTDPGTAQAKENVDKWRLSDEWEDVRRDMLEVLVDEPPPEVLATPQGISARLQPADNEPLQSDEHEQLHQQVASDQKGQRHDERCCAKAAVDKPATAPKRRPSLGCEEESQEYQAAQLHEECRWPLARQRRNLWPKCRGQRHIAAVGEAGLPHHLRTSGCLQAYRIDNGGEAPHRGMLVHAHARQAGGIHPLPDQRSRSARQEAAAAQLLEIHIHGHAARIDAEHLGPRVGDDLLGPRLRRACVLPTGWGPGRAR
mmetsp:Transcript_109504/g.283083  ORF Transcript_109504/g.283083 Transcript_109504/m.283083 type:complete len:292 (+) Transcript_109504:1822-2697(+)